jgi:hypothetical protein
MGRFSNQQQLDPVYVPVELHTGDPSDQGIWDLGDCVVGVATIDTESAQCIVLCGWESSEESEEDEEDDED